MFEDKREREFEMFNSKTDVFEVTKDGCKTKKYLNNKENLKT
tara:strand:+ start:348 stop:473 length:126 start_codon:yes stop_codon:yes gene_type:complete